MGYHFTSTKVSPYHNKNFKHLEWGSKIEQRTQQGALPKLISQLQARYTAKEPVFNLKIHSPIKINIILNL